MAQIENSLPQHTLLEHYRIESTLGGGGFSIVYLATDLNCSETVVIKEYLPKRLALRVDGLRVAPISEDTAESLNEGRRLFFHEAKALSQLSHPNIVEVLNFFSANDTVYMVMPYKEGKNLQNYISKRQGQLSEVFLRTIFPPLLDGLREVHRAGLLHLDIKPGNIHIQSGGEPILLDFGAVHRMQLSRKYQPTPVVTPGFSPIEQYDRKGYIGPWTDIYAIGATMRACIEGKAPPVSTDRRDHDTMKPAVQQFRRSKYPSTLLAALDCAMEVDPTLRPQSIDELLDAFSKVDTSESIDPTSHRVWDILFYELPSTEDVIGNLVNNLRRKKKGGE